MADYNTIITYNGNGTTTDFAIPFQYLNEADIVVTRQNGAVTYTFLNPSMIRINAALAVGDVLTIQRVTDLDPAAVTFSNGSVITAGQLNAGFNQTLYAAQEANDKVNRGLFADTSNRLDAQNRRIINVAAPTASGDAVNKAYADAIITTAAGSATAAANSADASAESATASAQSASAAAASAAAAATALDNFDDRYLGQKANDPSVDNDGNALIQGALYFNTTNRIMRVYDGSGWMDASSAAPATMATFTYVATAGQTVFTGADANSSVLSFTSPFLIVSLNGVELRPVVDYTTTGSTTVTLTSAADLNDEVQIIAFKAFEVANVPATNVTFNSGDSGSVTRTVQSKLKELPSVKDLGAAGDGVVNDTTSFTAMAAIGGTFYVPSGTYLIDYITVSKRLHLILSNGAVIKQRLPSNPATTLDTNWGLFRFIAGSEGSIIEGGTLDGNRDALAPYYNGHTRLGQDNHWWGVRTEFVDDFTILGTNFRNFMSEAFYGFGGKNFRALDFNIKDCGVAFAVQGNNELSSGCVIRGHCENIGNVIGSTAYYMFQHGITFGALKGFDFDVRMEGFCASKQGTDGSSTGGGKEPVPIAVNLYSLEAGKLNISTRDYTTPTSLTSAHIAINMSSVNNCTGTLTAFGYESALTMSSSPGNTFDINFDGDYVNAAGYTREGVILTHGGVFPPNVAGLAGEVGSNIISRDNVLRGSVSRFGIGVRDEGETNDLSGLTVYGNVTDGVQIVVAQGTSASYPVSRRRPSGGRIMDGIRCTTNGESGIIYTGGYGDLISNGFIRDNGQTIGSRTFPYNIAVIADADEGVGLRIIDNDVDSTAGATIINEVSYVPGSATAKPANRTYNKSTALTHTYQVVMRNSNHYRIGEIITLKGVLSGGADATGKIVDIDQDIITLAHGAALVYDATTNLDTLTGTGSTSGTTLTGVGTLFTTEIDFPVYLKYGSEYRRVVYVNSNTSAIIESPFSSNIPAGTALQVVRADVQTGVVAPTNSVFVNGNVTTGPFLLRDNRAQNLTCSINYLSFPGLDAGSRFDVEYSLTMAGTSLDNVIVSGLPQWASVVNSRIMFNTAITGLSGSVSLVLKDNGTTINTPINTWSGFTIGTVHKGPSPEAPAYKTGSGSVNFVSGSGNPSGTLTARLTIAKWAF